MKEQATASSTHSYATEISSPGGVDNILCNDQAQAIMPKRAMVLIVDDNTANLDLLRDMLKPLGAQIFFATSGVMALDIAKKTQPDLILMDIMMPDMDGLETCRRLKANKCLESIPVIFVTAKTEVEDLVKGFEAGGVDYIPKPVKQPEVHARVNAHLQIQKLIRQQQENLSALDRARKELQELNATKDKFLSSIGRILRDSLSEILSVSRAIKNWTVTDHSGQSDVTRQIEDVNKSAETGLELLENIMEWPRLQTGQKLDLIDTEITDQDLGYLVEALDNLKFLYLSGTRVTDAGLAHIKALKGLQELHLDGTVITNDGLNFIKGLRNLEVLDLKDTMISDDGLAHLQPLQDLKGLYLTRTQVSDAGLAHVGPLTGLRTLILWDTQVTDDGLGHLRSLHDLQELILWNTRVTKQGANELKKALPDCDISIDMFT